MLKWIGAVCVCVACGGIGFCMARELKERRELLAELRRCLLMLKGEISFGAATLPQCFCVVGARTNGFFRLFFTEIGDALQTQPQTTLCEVWQQQVQCVFAHSALTAEDLEWLSQIGERLSAPDAKTQAETLDYLVGQAKQLEEAAQSAYTAKARLFRCVGTMSGLLIVLLLI